MYEYILFDLDGTLTDPKEGITKSVQYALRHFGIDEPDIDNLTRFIGPPLHKSFSEYYGFSEAESQKAVEKYRERFSKIGIYENYVFEGISDLLYRLKEKNRVLAVATSKPEVFMLKILEKYDLKKYFDVMVGSEMDGKRTDKAEVIDEVFRRLYLTEADKYKAIMVGDRKYDIYGAKACGISCIGVEFGYAEDDELQLAGADYVISCVSELEELLLNKK